MWKKGCLRLAPQVKSMRTSAQRCPTNPNWSKLIETHRKSPTLIRTGVESDENDGGNGGDGGGGGGGGCCGDAMVPMVGATAATTMMFFASRPAPQ